MMQNTRFQSTRGQDDDAQRKTKEPNGTVRTRTTRGLVERERKRSGPNATENGNINEEGGDYQTTAARLLTLTCNAGIIMSSMMVLKELLLPKLLDYMPIIMRYVKEKMLSTRVAMMRHAEHGARLAGGYPAIASTYAMILLAASASRLSNELRLIVRIVRAGIAILGIHGIPTNAMRMTSASDDGHDDDASDSGSILSSSSKSDEQELEAEQNEKRDEEATGTDEDEDKAYRDYTTFWETRPSREMTKQLSSQEIDGHKTDLNVATLETWKLKVLTFFRRRHPQFGALLQLAWTEDNAERPLEIISDNEQAAAANMWGASALLALIDVKKPKGTVFEHELLELERQVPGTTSSGVEIAMRIKSLLTERHTGDEEADYKKMETTQYLKLGMDKDSIKLAIALLQSHLRISPKRVREAPHALFRMILKKVPNEIKEKCDLITERINIAEAAGENVEPIFNGSVLTLQSLSNEIVEYIKKASTKVQVEVSAAEREKRKKVQVAEWAKKPPCTMCASTSHGWGDCKLKAKCAFLACQCARDKACWVDADEMPIDKELVNALGKPIVGKLKEKLIKCRTDKGKTVSSVEACDECETLELECSVLEAQDLNIPKDEPTKLLSTTFDDMPTVIVTRVVELAYSENPFVLTPVSRGFQTAVSAFVDSAYETEERLHAIEKEDNRARYTVQRQAHAASPSLRTVCAEQIQQATMRFLAHRRAMRRDAFGVELETSSAVLGDISEMSVRVQIDGGANTSLFVTSAISARATRTGSTTPLGLAGKGQHLPTQGDATLTIELVNELSEVLAAATISGVLAPTGRRDLFGITPMYDAIGLTFLPEPWLLAIHPASGRAAPMIRWHGLFMMDANITATGISFKFDKVLKPLDLSSLVSYSPSEVSTVDVQTHHKFLLLAAQMHMDSSGLRRHAGAASIFDYKTVPANAARLVDSDGIRIASNLRRTPTADKAPAMQRPTEIGHTFQVDGFGHVGTKAVGGMNTYQWLLIDAVSDYIYDKLTTTSNLESLFEFLDVWLVEEKALDHKPKVLIFDACPTWATSSTFSSKVAVRYGCKVIIAAGGDHNKLPKMEAAQDPLTRMAEAMLKRRGWSKGFFLHARAYAVQVRNSKVANHQTHTRIHRHTGKPSDITFTIFGTTCAILKDGLNSQRTEVGTERTDNADIIGYEPNGHKFILWSSDTQRIIHRANPRPLNEMQLALTGIPASGTATEAEAQTDDDATYAPLVLAAPPMPPPAPIVIKAGYEPLPDGTRIEMCFDTGKKATTWYPGTVTESKVQDNGRVHTAITWDDPSWADDPKWKGKFYDLTSLHQPWRLLAATAAPAPAAPTAPATAPQQGAPRRVLRSAGLAMPTSAAIERALHGLSETASIDAFNAIAHQWLGHIVAIEVQSIEELDKARELIHKLECNLNKVDPFQSEVSATELADDLEVAKVLKNIVDVKSASGEWYTISIPKNERALSKDPHEAEWRASHQAAHEAVLANPLNRLVKRKDAKAIPGVVIAPIVMQDSVKKDPATNQLLKFKSRICSDGNRMARILKSKGLEDTAPSHSLISDNLQLKLLLSTATLGDVQDEQGRRVLPWRDEEQDEEATTAARSAKHGTTLRDLMAKDPKLRRVPNDVTSSDFKNAYAKAERLRPVGYMETYEKMVDDEGDVLCYELAAPIWGEKAAGNEWEQHRNKRFAEAGLTESMTVPGVWHMEDAHADSRVVLITNVDDILYKETGGRNRVLTERLIKHFKLSYGNEDVTVQYKPQSWNGYAFAWSADGSCVTLSMELHIVQLARDYVPELLDADATIPADILSGTKLQAAADALTKPDVPPTKMCAAGKETQQIAGGTSYVIAGVQPRFSLLQHRLACVASLAKQPEARTVARSLIAALYLRRKEGITYGGQLAERVMLQGGLYANVDLEASAPEEAEIHADANADGRSVYALVLTHNGGAVAHAVKKISTVVEIVDELGSVGNESVATERASQLGAYAAEILRIFGHPQQGPIVIGTDNSANLTLSLGTATPGKAKHAMRRWATIRTRVRQGIVTIVKVDTASMPVDFMTKWKGRKQTDVAVAYITNSKNQITNSDPMVGALEVSMLLRSGRMISKPQPVQEPTAPSLFDAYLAVGMPPVAQIEALFVEEDGYADYDQGDIMDYGSDHLGSNSDILDHQHHDSEGEMEVEEEDSDKSDGMEPEISALELNPAHEEGSPALMIVDLNAVLAHHGLDPIVIPKHEMIPRNTRFVFEYDGLPHDHKPIFAEVWERYTLNEDNMPHVPRGILTPDPPDIPDPAMFAIDYEEIARIYDCAAQHVADSGHHALGRTHGGLVTIYFGPMPGKNAEMPMPGDSDSPDIDMRGEPSYLYPNDDEEDEIDPWIFGDPSAHGGVNIEFNDDGMEDDHDYDDG